MGLFSTLMNKVFHAAGEAERPHDAAPGGTVPVSRVQVRRDAGSAPPAGGTAGAGTAAGAATQVDVAAALDKLAAGKGEKLDWRKSIVDLMKTVDMDSSLAARKDLAKDLNYTGDTNDSAAMNMWLHKEVMRRFAENGGKLPADLDAR
jgi:hypothetical protein